MVRKNILKTTISIMIVFNFYYCYLTPPLELVIDSVEKNFHSQEARNGVLIRSMALYT